MTSATHRSEVARVRAPGENPLRRIKNKPTKVRTFYGHVTGCTRVERLGDLEIAALVERTASRESIRASKIRFPRRDGDASEPVGSNLRRARFESKAAELALAAQCRVAAN
jgi:hypothetical protein